MESTETTEQLKAEYEAAKVAYEAAKVAYKTAKAAYELACGPAWQIELLDSIDSRRKGRIESVKIAIGLGADEATCRKITKAAKVNRDGGTIAVETRYGGLSRGKAWARNKATDEWADKNGGTVYLEPGNWLVGSSDGFNRKERPVEWDVELVKVGDQNWLIAN